MQVSEQDALRQLNGLQAGILGFEGELQEQRQVRLLCNACCVCHVYCTMPVVFVVQCMLCNADTEYYPFAFGLVLTVADG